eukprot:CAMPEP_0202451672 /NCGR_PEP_ID=MMETSP1360-20130828/10058_1 /ASSEMBLY_ACC=CAM_ASM_000848 /TAXON_ID=515479 /ORGANISM="Licmophora paradoxa, Strain CCMP2313" /LENGTH=966 /DNA_ID=CAMNT_0049070303 /DNA_START=52 /DNA_END=2952 /DNA_ORIENTATION=+
MSSSEEKKELEWPMDKVRSTFINFFVEQHEHVYWKSSPCVPHDDPTLLFANAGMNQFKAKFLGTCDPKMELFKINRAVNSQKCIRAGGKHNDLDDVGKDVYHHTFFEMLGNWSFGNYFKKEAIAMAWKCLTEEFKLNPERLYATYFGGDESSPCDDEAREIWLQYLPPDRVLPFDAKDNFWEMGATGPCGPCTEIHYDRIGGRDASKLVNADLPDVIEIWNNVFIQYNREADRSLRKLPQQHVDTGMGMERLVSILQNVDSNYDTDIFIPIFDHIQKLTGASPYSGKVGEEDTGFKDMAYRVVADHIRTLSFAIADGAVPSNDGRGYVLRRILRRAIRYGRQNLGADLGFFCQLVPTLVDLMSGTYPELKEKQEHVTQIIREEEESFGRTLDKGLSKFKDMAKKSENGMFSGIDAHFLYTSMGFPVDLTELMAEEIGLKLDKDGFEAKMKEEQELSAAAHAAKMSGDSGKDMRLVAEQTSALVGKGVKATDDAGKYVWNQDLEGCIVKGAFIGRNETEDNIGFVDSMTSENGTVGLILDKTAFYAEAGGQIFDTGSIVNSNGAVMKVHNVQLYGQFILHVGEVTEGTFAVDDSVICKVDYERRSPIAANHTMTHVLNYALKEVLVTRPLKESGKESTVSVDQKGSLVDESKLRYDFSWNAQLTLAQLKDIESICQGIVDEGIPVQAEVASLEMARKISSLRAVFGETYPDPVRVVAIAPQSIPEILESPDSAQWDQYSVEFCGGTHLNNTKEADAFVLLSEEGIAKGIRRVTGLTKVDAAKAIADAAELLAKVKAAGSLEGGALEKEVKILTEAVNVAKISTVTKLEARETLTTYSKQVMAYKKEKAAAQQGLIVEEALKLVGSAQGTKLVLRYDFGVDGKIAKGVMTSFGKKCKDKALMLISVDEASDRIMVVASAPKGGDVDCKAWVNATTEGMGGKGGGKKDSAQCTVPGVSHVEEILKKAQS